MADVETLENFYVRVVAPPMAAVLITAVMVICYARVDMILAWDYLAFMLFLGLGLPMLSWMLSSVPGRVLVSRRAALQAWLVDGVQGLSEILAFGRGVHFSEKLASHEIACGRTQRQLGSLTGLSNALTILLVNLGMLSILFLAIPMVRSGQVSGVMLAVLTLSAYAGFEAVTPLPLAAQTLSSSLQAARRLFEVVDAAPAVRDRPSGTLDSTAQPRITNCELRMTGLSFTYPGWDRPALQDITFHLPPGKRIAVVGPSGAGKSTLVNLLLRFWDYSLGSIWLDGHDFREFSQEQVRRQISVIPQRPYFFNDTIRQNLLLARPRADDPEIKLAAQQAQIHEFIQGLPNGYETIIGERGFRLSGGERQRLAVARAFLKNSPIFLLDEPTANLDPLTEKSLLDMLFPLTSGRSLLLITHRLVGLENMDEILVLDQGRIVERGTHADLLVSRGLYHRLWDLQNRFMPEIIMA